MRLVNVMTNLPLCVGKGPREFDHLFETLATKPLI